MDRRSTNLVGAVTNRADRERIKEIQYCESEKNVISKTDSG